MKQVKAGLIFLGFAGALAIYAPAQALVSLIWPAHARIPSRVFFIVFSALAGLKVRQEGAPLDADEEGGFLIVSNHVSYFDVAALGQLLPVAFVAKTEVAGWPIMGWLTKLSGAVFINRNSRAAAARDKRAIQARLEGGGVMALFPEGTSSDGIHVLPFKSALLGAVEPAGEKRDIWVQPVSITYKASCGLPLSRRTRPSYAWYGDMDFLPHKWGAYLQGPFEVVVRFHPPARRSDFSSRKALSSWCEAVVRAGLDHDLAGRPGAPALPEKPGARAVEPPEAVAAE